MSGVPLTGQLVPAGAGGFPLIADSDLLGGYRVVANLAGLVAVPALDRKPGMLVRVMTVRDFFVWQSPSSLTADGISIVADTGGQWVRSTFSPDPSWAFQATWYIDPVAGNDENTGVDSSHAIKTGGEIARRLNNQTLQQSTTVHQLGDLTETIRFSIALGDNHLAQANQFLWLGDPSAWTVLRSGTLTAATPLNALTNTPNDITDSSIGNWTTAGPGGTSLVTHRIRLTSGPNAGAVAFILKSLSPTKVRTTSWKITDPVTIVSAFSALINPAGNETYVVERLPGVGALDVTARRASMQADGLGWMAFKFDSLEIGKGYASDDSLCAVACTSSLIQSLVNRSRINCSISGGSNGILLNIVSCLVVYTGTRAISIAGNVGFISGGAYSTAVLSGVSDPRVRLTLGLHWMVQGGSLNVSAGIFISSSGVAIFDSQSDGLIATNTVGSSGIGVLAASVIWGSGNAGAGVNLDAGCQIITSIIPTITGSSPGVNDVLIDGVPYAWSAMPYLNVPRLCGIIQR